MYKTSASIIGAIAIVGLAFLASFWRQSQARLRMANESLQQQLTISRLTAENERLSNLVVQAQLAGANAQDQFQELVKVQAEVNRLRLEKEQSSELIQAQMARSASNQWRELSELRGEVSGLSEEIGTLGGAIEELYAAALMPREQDSNAEPSPDENRSLAIRIIETSGITFAEKLKRSTSAEEGETFPEVYGRFLRANGIDLSNVAALVFDERTGRVIVRATRSSLDRIEQATIALDQAQ